MSLGPIRLEPATPVSDLAAAMLANRITVSVVALGTEQA